MSWITYFIYPHPPAASYGSPKVIVLLTLCIGMIVVSVILRYWRKSQDTRLRKLSGPWGTGLMWFGIVGLVLVGARVEEIQFVAMPGLWLVWAAVFALFVALQVRLYRAKYYQILPTASVDDPRQKYLPKRR